jgi:hypothetical protein
MPQSWVGTDSKETRETFHFYSPVRSHRTELYDAGTKKFANLYHFLFYVKFTSKNTNREKINSMRFKLYLIKANWALIEKDLPVWSQKVFFVNESIDLHEKVW